MSPFENLSAVVAQAQRFRETEELCRDRGYVYVYRGKWAGWSADYPDPHRWCPGVVAVSPGGAAYLLVGGNDNDGANDLFLLHPGTDSNGFLGDSVCSPASQTNH